MHTHQGSGLVVKHVFLHHFSDALGRLSAKPLSSASQSASRKWAGLPDSQSESTALNTALKDISEDVVLSFGRFTTMEKHLHRLAEGSTAKASEAINTAIQTDKPSQNSHSIQNTPLKKNDQATANDND